MLKEMYGVLPVVAILAVLSVKAESMSFGPSRLPADNITIILSPSFCSQEWTETKYT